MELQLKKPPAPSDKNAMRLAIQLQEEYLGRPYGLYLECDGKEVLDFPHVLGQEVLNRLIIHTLQGQISGMTFLDLPGLSDYEKGRRGIDITKFKANIEQMIDRKFLAGE